MRASDDDRETVASELRTHCVQGRLTVDELEARLQGVMGARTLRELAEYVYDLPPPAARPESERAERRRPAGRPGVLPFTRRLIVPAALDRTSDVLLEAIAPPLNRHGYVLVSRSAAELVFERSRKPRGRWLAAVLFFPVGLLVLLVRGQDERIVISLDRRGPERTSMTVHGQAPRSVRRAFERLVFT